MKNKFKTFQERFKIPVSTRHRFDIHTTSITLKQRRMDVKTTSCAYWDILNPRHLFNIIVKESKKNLQKFPITFPWFFIFKMRENPYKTKVENLKRKNTCIIIVIILMTMMLTLLREPNTHTTLFWHPYDVVLTLWTLYRHRNDVVCLLGNYAS